MNGLIILTSMIFVAYLIFTIIKTKKTKYILSPIVSLLYGFLLFFIGMGISSTLYLILAVLPVVFVIFHIVLLR